MIKFIDFLPTFQVNVYGVSTLATVAIHDEMHVTSHCTTHVLSHNYGRKAFFSSETLSNAQLYLVKNSFLAYFVSRTILAVTEHMQQTIFHDWSYTPDFSLTTQTP